MLTDSPNLAGAFCVWFTQNLELVKDLSGRFLSSKWDIDELLGRLVKLLRTIYSKHDLLYNCDKKDPQNIECSHPFITFLPQSKQVNAVIIVLRFNCHILISIYIIREGQFNIGSSDNIEVHSNVLDVYENSKVIRQLSSYCWIWETKVRNLRSSLTILYSL